MLPTGRIRGFQCHPHGRGVARVCGVHQTNWNDCTARHSLSVLHQLYQQLFHDSDIRAEMCTRYGVGMYLMLEAMMVGPSGQFRVSSSLLDSQSAQQQFSPLK
ncbi:hypothetical protein AcW1_009890 [Taiwanofungus camphoratus]|nr:hypothetical protein AcV7_005244 [Antrodia cinnamomea]KAI0946423.1 hypothetical protein AcW1_009890 [Antrodia cinnamomea]